MNQIYTLSFSPDGKILAANSAFLKPKFMILGNINNPQQHNAKYFIQLWEVNDIPVDCSSFPKDKMVYPVSTSSLIGLGKKCLASTKTLKGHEHIVFKLSFSHDGKKIASASFDKTVKVWNLDDTTVQTFKGYEYPV
ncbi:WD-40 repeat protein [Beggiatoa sp. PS]|nr:WD-40 repeat protein [Beggiatoa sp. PS]